VKFGVIVDVEASRSIRQAEVGAAKTMIERTEERFGLKPERLAADTAYGAAPMLNWLVEEKSIAPHAFPSFLQGGRTKPTEMPPLDAPVGEMFVEFAAKPTFDNFLMCFQFANAFGFPPGAGNLFDLPFRPSGLKS
jgi:hypothetical protein